MLPLFLLIAVLAPSGSVLWFMNDAARSQAEAARQRVTEAYRAQARILRDRVDESWKARVSSLDGVNDFVGAWKASGADAIILLDERGRPVYPARPAGPAPDPATDRPAWQLAEAQERGGKPGEAAALWESIANSERDPNLAGRAAQAEIRCLLGSGHRDAALGEIERRFGSGRWASARDLEGRLLAPDEQLLELHLLKRGAPRFEARARQLAERVNRYDDPPMLSAQRLFLMNELHALAPYLADFRWEAAETLAEQVLEAGRVTPLSTALESSGFSDVWKVASGDQRVLALYRSGTVAALTAPILKIGLGGARFTVAAPGAPPSDGVAAGRMLPGWQIAFTLFDTQALEQTGARRRAAYVWMGSTVIAAAILMSFGAVQFFRRLSRLNRLKTDLLAAVSHELRTPLASMRLLVETLLEDGQADAVKTREYLQLIAAENLRLARLVENFLTFSRIERNRQHFEFAPTTPAAVVESAVAAMGERLHAPGCQLDIEVNPGLPPLVADENALITVLRNLLDNACKYTPAEKRIRIRAHEQNGRVAFEVEDNGIGIAPREQKRVFRRFYQVDRRLARETGGCGLGLSIVEYIVRAHGGEVTVESQPGAGSTFHVLLPCQAAAREAAGA